MLGRQVFHAGTATNEAGEVTSVGGRVLAVTAMGADVAEAQTKAYQVSMIVQLSTLHPCVRVGLSARGQDGCLCRAWTP